MKKKIIIFILLLIPVNVLGLNYEYKDKYETSDDYIILEERWYKFYEEEKVYTDDYFLEGDNPEEYPYLSTDKITKEYYSKEELEEISGREVSKENIDVYYPLKKVNRIELRGFSSDVVISEIEVTYKDEKVSYYTYCYDCSDHISYGFNNGIYMEYLGYVDHYSTVELMLDQEYNPSDLKVTLYFYNISKTMTFNVYYFDKDISKHFNYNSNTFLLNYIKFDIDTSNLDDVEDYVKKRDLVLEKSNIIRYKWDSDYVTNIDKDEIFYKKENIDLYKYIDTYYKYYKINKNYLKGYFLEAESYTKDENDYITKYLYIEKEDNNDICDSLSNDIDDKKEINNKTLSNKITNPSTFYKFRYIYIVIISITLLLMGYMLYSLRKE